MKKSAEPHGSIKFTEDQLTKSWVSIIPDDLWKELASTMNFSGEYPKGTQTTVKHITYHQALNKIAEQIRICNKSRFRTETELFKIALHLGMQILYHVFCAKSDLAKQSRVHFFYKAFEMTTRTMERATMVAALDRAMKDFSELLAQGAITQEEVNHEFDILFSKVPEGDREYVKNLVADKAQGSVRHINSILRNKFNQVG